MANKQVAWRNNGPNAIALRALKPDAPHYGRRYHALHDGTCTYAERTLLTTVTTEKKMAEKNIYLIKKDDVHANRSTPTRTANIV